VATLAQHVVKHARTFLLAVQSGQVTVDASWKRTTSSLPDVRGHFERFDIEFEPKKGTVLCRITRLSMRSLLKRRRVILRHIMLRLLIELKRRILERIGGMNRLPVVFGGRSSPLAALDRSIF